MGATDSEALDENDIVSMLLVQCIKNVYSNSKCYKRSVPETCPLINIANSMIVIAFMLVLLLGYLICIGNIISYLLIVV